MLRNIQQQNVLENRPPKYDIDDVAPQVEVDELVAEYKTFEKELEEILPPDAFLALKENKIDTKELDKENDDNWIEVGRDQSVLVLEAETQKVEEEPETYEIVDIEPDVREDEYESLTHQEKTIETEKNRWEEHEKSTAVLEEDLDKKSTNIDQASEELTNEVKLIRFQLSQAEKELESISKDELTLTEIKQGEEITLDVVEETKQHEERIDYIEIEFRDYEETEREREEESVQLKETSESITTEVMRSEGTIIDQNLELEDQAEKKVLDKLTEQEEILREEEIEELPDFIEIQDDVIVDQESAETLFTDLDQQATEEEFKELNELEERVEAAIEEVAEIIETKNENQLLEHEDKVQSEIYPPSTLAYLSNEIADIENSLAQLQIEIPIYQSIGSIQTNYPPQQQSFGLSSDVQVQHDFSITQLYTEIRALEKMLGNYESPRLLEQFHTQVEENVQQLLDVETHQTAAKLVDSLELVSQGPSLPEPPPYDFRAELEEWEDQSNSNRGQLPQSFEEAKRKQSAASLNFALKNQTLQAQSNNQEANFPTEKSNQSVTQQEEVPKEHRVQNQTEEFTHTIQEITTHQPSLSERESNSIIQFGNRAVKTGKYLDLKNLAKKWNEYIAKGGRPTTEMWELYNKIQELHMKPIVLYKEDDKLNAYKMSICGGLYSELDSKLFNKRLSNPAKQISKLLDYWLIQRGKKEGIKPFFEVTIKNPDSKEIETYWIPNAKQRIWNPYIAKDQRFFFGKRAAGGMITQFLTTKIKLTEKHVDLYPVIEKLLRKKYPKLGVQTGRINLEGQKVLFKTFFQLNHAKEVIDEAIKLVFWKYVDTHNINYIQNSSQKISELLTYCNENKIVNRKDITKMRIFVPNSKILIQNKQHKRTSPEGESRKTTKKLKTLNNEFDSSSIDNKTNINSRPIVYNLLTSLQRIGKNFGLNGRSPIYKPPENLILEYDNIFEEKLIIKAESKSDKALSHFLLEGFGLTTRTDIKRGAFWFNKIIYPTKGNYKNEWFRFTEFLSSTCERKIENHNRWFSSKHAGGAKTVRRRIIVEIDLNAFKALRAELYENGKILANDSSHRRWVIQSRADARRNKNPERALQRVEEKIAWWNHIRSNLPIGSEAYQKQALLFIMNTKRSANECLARMLIEQKITNVELSKIAHEIEEFSPVRRLIDSTSGKPLTLNEILQITDIDSISRRGIVFDVFNENLGANIAFKAQLDFFNKYNPSQSPLVEYLGLDANEVKNCEIETHWHDRKGYPATGLSMADTFAPDIVVRNKMGNIIAVIQLKGYSQTRTSMQPNSSIFQLLELIKYENNPRIKTALVNVNQEDDYIRYEWLVFEKIHSEQQNKFIETISTLREQSVKHPEIDPLIPRNMRKRALTEHIYEKAIECNSTYKITDYFNQIKEIILDSEKNFYRFIGQNERNIITEEMIENYLTKLQDPLQKLVDQVGQPNGIDSFGQFRYHWAKEVALNYYERIQEYLKYSYRNR